MNDRTIKLMTSSNSCEWATPQHLFDELNAIYNFDLDVCATTKNAKCERFFTKQQNGLEHEWTGRCWMNPPYGREIGLWMRKAYESVQRECKLVVCLVPVRTDTKWFHDWVLGKADIQFIKGRLHFSGSTTAAPFPSMLVIYKRKIHAGGIT